MCGLLWKYSLQCVLKYFNETDTLCYCVMQWLWWLCDPVTFSLVTLWPFIHFRLFMTGIVTHNLLFCVRASDSVVADIQLTWYLPALIVLPVLLQWLCIVVWPILIVKVFYSDGILDGDCDWADADLLVFMAVGYSTWRGSACAVFWLCVSLCVWERSQWHSGLNLFYSDRVVGRQIDLLCVWHCSDVFWSIHYYSFLFFWPVQYCFCVEASLLFWLLLLFWWFVYFLR